MFSLENHKAKIANFNPRTEKHGDENVLAGDIKFEVTCSNSTLDHFDKALKKMLYRSAPLCGKRGDHYRMTINLPLGHACANCQRIYRARAKQRNAGNNRHEP